MSIINDKINFLQCNTDENCKNCHVNSNCKWNLWHWDYVCSPFYPFNPNPGERY